jgi:putative sugar O-methyltransferase
MKTQFNGVWTVPGNSPINYINECELIAQDDTKFNTFRSRDSSPYTHIVGMSTAGTHGKDFLNFVRNEDVKILDYITDIKRNDIYGSPMLQEHDGIGSISGNTLQYMMSTTYIRRHFGNIQLGNIVEIGGGYGGLCTVLTSTTPYETYTILDLPSPSLVQKKYLNKLGIKNTIFTDTNNIQSGNKYDLCISEYCISEFNDKGQDFYINNVIQYCKGAYFLLNFNNTPALLRFIDKLKVIFDDVDLCQYPMTPELNGCKNGKYLICKNNKII